jgi:hypothetical protein
MIYYLKNKNNEIIVTIVLISRNNKWNRGIAIRAKKDTPRKEIGRGIASERALNASVLFNRKHVIFSDSVFQSLLSRVRPSDLDKCIGEDLSFKSFPNAELSEYEKYILRRYHKSIKGDRE